MTQRAGRPKGSRKSATRPVAFADRLRQLLNGVGCSQAHLAASIGVATGTVSGWMSGGRLPAGEDLGRLSQFFGCSLDWLLLGQPGSDGPEEEAISALRADWREMTEVVVKFALNEIGRPGAVASARKRRGDHAGEGWGDECHRAAMEAAAAALSPQALIRIAGQAYKATHERERLEWEAAELLFHRRMAQVRSVERQTGREQSKMRAHAMAPLRAKRSGGTARTPGNAP
jgi:transcriptional regulator with XRE-family HTH domain